MVHQIHKASAEEILAADRNSYAVWGEGLSVEQYLMKCQASVRRNRAQCWVLLEDDRVVSSLGCHPLQFCYQGIEYCGFGIASVYTHEQYRKRGLAEQLCRTVMAYEQANNAQFALLFSDVSPQYYGKMGFTLHSDRSYEYQSLESLSAGRSTIRLRAFDPATEIRWLQEAYRKGHREDMLFVARSKEYWMYSLLANSSDQFWLVLNEKNQEIGYIRLLFLEDRAILKECILPLLTCGEVLSSVYYRIAEMLLSKNIALLQTWQPPPQELQGCVEASVRDHALPMIWKGSMIQEEAEAIALRTKIYSPDYF